MENRGFKLEGDFKKWFRRTWEGDGQWMESYEPRRGGGTGIPDIQVLLEGRLIPIELKVGRFENFNILFPEEVRADQIGWHNRFNSAGGYSFFMIGMKEYPAGVAFVDYNAIEKWRSGIKNINWVRFANDQPDDFLNTFKSYVNNKRRFRF